MDVKILNPYSDRNVSTRGKLGKKILEELRLIDMIKKLPGYLESNYYPLHATSIASFKNILECGRIKAKPPKSHIKYPGRDNYGILYTQILDKDLGKVCGKHKIAPCWYGNCKLELSKDIYRHYNYYPQEATPFLNLRNKIKKSIISSRKQNHDFMLSHEIHFHQDIPIRFIKRVIVQNMKCKVELEQQMRRKGIQIQVCVFALNSFGDMRVFLYEMSKLIH